MTNELKLCPFCGGEVSIAKAGDILDGYWYFITRGHGDNKCQCRLWLESKKFSEEENEHVRNALIDQWNIRYKRTCKMPMYHGEDANDDLPAYYRNFKCDACGELHSRYKHDDYEFCPHCGAEVVDGD